MQVVLVYFQEFRCNLLLKYALGVAAENSQKALKTRSYLNFLDIIYTIAIPSDAELLARSTVCVPTYRMYLL